MNKSLMPAMALAATLAVAPFARAANQVGTPGGQYHAVPTHTQVVFDIMHLGISPFYGIFGKVTGSLQFDADAVEKSFVNIEVDTGSLTTASDKVTTELKSPSTFDAVKFPSASFKSTHIRKTSANTGDITGDLTLHGITKPVTLHATFYGAQQMGGIRLGFGATGKIKRSDFGITGMRWESFVADDVDLMIEAEFVQETK